MNDVLNIRQHGPSFADFGEISDRQKALVVAPGPITACENSVVVVESLRGAGDFRVAECNAQFIVRPTCEWRENGQSAISIGFDEISVARIGGAACKKCYPAFAITARQSKQKLLENGYARSVRLPGGDVPASAGAGLSKSAVSRRFVALSAARMKEWMASDLSGLDLLVIQIDGIHMDEDMILVAAVGVDAMGDKHPLGLIEGATENAATVQALIDNLIERGLDPAVPRLFIIDGAKALSKAIRRTFGPAAAIQRCQVHKARNIMERLPKSLHASVRRVLRQAWELDDADKAERLIRTLAQRLERDWSGVSGSILEGIDEILTVTRLGLPKELRRSLACTNIIENVMGTVRRVCRNVKRWRSAAMAMRWTAAAMQEAAKGFRRLKAHKQLPALRAALEAHQNKNSHGNLVRQANAA